MENTPGIRDRVIGIAQRMRRALGTGEEMHRSHRSVAKCRRCSLRPNCGEELEGSGRPP